MLDVGAVAPGEDADWRAVVGMITKYTQRAGRRLCAGLALGRFWIALLELKADFSVRLLDQKR